MQAYKLSTTKHSKWNKKGNSHFPTDLNLNKLGNNLMNILSETSTDSTKNSNSMSEYKISENMTMNASLESFNIEDKHISLTKERSLSIKFSNYNCQYKVSRYD